MKITAFLFTFFLSITAFSQTYIQGNSLNTNSIKSLAGVINLNTSQLNNCVDPTSAQDVATKHYVDSLLPVSTVWGTITGTLSNQTDLQTALDAKSYIIPVSNTVYVSSVGSDVTCLMSRVDLPCATVSKAMSLVTNDTILNAIQIVNGGVYSINGLVIKPNVYIKGVGTSTTFLDLGSSGITFHTDWANNNYAGGVQNLTITGSSGPYTFDLGTPSGSASNITFYFNLSNIKTTSSIAFQGTGNTGNVAFWYVNSLFTGGDLKYLDAHAIFATTGNTTGDLYFTTDDGGFYVSYIVGGAYVGNIYDTTTSGDYVVAAVTTLGNTNIYADGSGSIVQYSALLSQGNINITGGATVTPFSDSYSLGYQPTNAGNWSVLPSNVRDALDYISNTNVMNVPMTAGGVIYTDGSVLQNVGAGTSGQVLTSSGAGAPTWTTVGGTGTVTSVGVADTSGTALFNVTGSPVTGSGTIDLTLASGAQNLALMTPNGSSGQPTLRAILAADIPTLNQNTTGTAANITATSNSSLITLSSLSLPGSQVSSAVANATAAVTATNLASGVIGDIPYQTAANTTGYIVPGTSGYVLTSNGPGVAPTYQAAGGSAYTFIDSLVNTAGNVSLVNDNATPGNTMYYGTDGTGTKGFYSIGAAANNYWTLSGSDITNNNAGKVNINAPTATIGALNIGQVGTFSTPGMTSGLNGYEIDIGENYSHNLGYVQAYNGNYTTYEPLGLNPLGGDVAVGMGTAAPNALFEVNGTSQFDGTLTMSGSNAIVGNVLNMNSPTASVAEITINKGGSIGSTPAISIGGSTNYYRFDIGRANGPDTGWIQNYAGSSSTYGVTEINPLGGNVGIGISSAPVSALEVGGDATFDNDVTINSVKNLNTGNILVTSSIGAPNASPAPISIGVETALYNAQISMGNESLYYRMDMGYSNSSNLAWLQSYNGGSSTYGALALNPGGGNVVIGGGTSSGDQTLTVVGHIGLEGSAPTISSCGGGSIAAGSSDHKGKITGITAATACTITFSSVLATAPACVFSSSVLGTDPYVSSIATSSVVAGMNSLTGTLYYLCF